VRRAAERKRRANATYAMIDEYRPTFLIKHPSRGKMRAEDKQLIAYIYRHRMSAGETWVAVDELPAARVRAEQIAAEEAQRAAQEEVRAPIVRGDELFRQFTKEHSAEARRARPLNPLAWVGAKWEASPHNPKNAAASEAARAREAEAQAEAARAVAARAAEAARLEELARGEAARAAAEEGGVQAAEAARAAEAAEVARVEAEKVAEAARAEAMRAEATRAEATRAAEPATAVRMRVTPTHEPTDGEDPDDEWALGGFILASVGINQVRVHDDPQSRVKCTFISELLIADVDTIRTRLQALDVPASPHL